MLVMCSENGTNFVGANKKLKTCIRNLTHMGAGEKRVWEGWESLIHSVKGASRVIAKDKLLLESHCTPSYVKKKR